MSSYIFYWQAAIFVLLYPSVYLGSVLYSIWRKFFGKNRWEIQKGDVAVITGSAHGLGKEFAQQLAQKGCHICIVDINENLAKEVAKELELNYGIKAKAYQVNVGSYEELEKLHKKIKEDFGPVTLLINNAGVLILPDPFLTPQPEEILNMIKVNFIAHLWATKLFLPDMKKLRKGHIVSVCSIAGFLTAPCAEIYTSTKFAVRGFMRSLRQHLDFEDLPEITCTTICPYFLNTNKDVMDFYSFASLDLLHPLLEQKDVVATSLEAILKGETEVIITPFYSLIIKLIDLLPSEPGEFLMNSYYKWISMHKKGQQFYSFLKDSKKI